MLYKSRRNCSFTHCDHYWQKAGTHAGIHYNGYRYLP